MSNHAYPDFASGWSQPGRQPGGTPRDLPPTRSVCTRRACVPDLVSAVASASPEATALSATQSDGSRTDMSYRELDTRSSQLAAHLRELGVGPEVVVAIHLERSFDYIVAALAVWKAGGAYLPLDPSWPAERRAWIIADSGSAVLVTRGYAATKARYLVDLDSDVIFLRRSEASFRPSVTTREQLAYVVYTSGSTGNPKGVEVTHGNLLNLVFWHRRAFGVGSADRASHLAGLAFDASVWELWPYLTAGASVVLAEENARTSPALLAEWIVNQGVTISFVPTALAESMISGKWPAETRLRYLLTGADTLLRRPSPALSFKLVNNYGPTECTVVATSGIVDAASVAAGTPPIGTAIANTQILILDPHGAPMAEGEVGEIYIAGTSVARGYRSQPELTAERFLSNPFSSVPGARMYRTGDLGCLMPDGQIAFRGRLDDQEKIRGHRIEPGEIAAALLSHPGVLSCAAASKGGSEAEKRLVAYVVLAPGASPSDLDLREFAARRLPDYMVPSAFVRLDRLPLNSSGKLDRDALPDPAPSNRLNAAEFRAPESAVQKRIAHILGGLLPVDLVGLDDNFFLMGGHSLLGAQLVLRLKEQFGIELTLRNLFETQTVARLAEEIERQLVSKLDSMSEEEAGRMLAALGND